MIKKFTSLFPSDSKSVFFLTPHWQNLKLQNLVQTGCFPLWVQADDFTVRHYSRSKLTDWTSEGWIEDKMTSKTSLKLSSLLYMQNKSLKVWKFETPVLHINLGACTRIAFLYWVFDFILSFIQLSQDFKVRNGRPFIRKISVKTYRCHFKTEA